MALNNTKSKQNVNECYTWFAGSRLFNLNLFSAPCLGSKHLTYVVICDAIFAADDFLSFAKAVVPDVHLAALQSGAAVAVPLRLQFVVTFLTLHLQANLAAFALILCLPRQTRDGRTGTSVTLATTFECTCVADDNEPKKDDQP